jgi:GT2 family glycosyltransferase
MIDLSIIIVSYNNRELLRHCLQSVYENTNVSYEVFVVDNNSQDNTLQMVQEYYPQVKVIDNQENVGFARANNQALRQAQGRYLLLLNNDTFVLGDCFDQLVRFMDRQPNVGAVSPKLLNSDGVTVQIQGSGVHKKQWLSAKPVPVSFISGAAFMVRRETYKNVGGLDEKFFFYNEDLDWCKRIRSYGWEIYYYPDSAVIHYGGKSTGFISSRALVEGIKGGVYFCYKHYRWIFPLYWVLILIYCLGGVCFNVTGLFQAARRERLKGFSRLIYILIAGQYR